MSDCWKECNNEVGIHDCVIECLTSDRDRLAADVEALAAFVGVVDDYEAEFDGVQPIIDARAAIEPILAARRVRG